MIDLEQWAVAHDEPAALAAYIDPRYQRPKHIDHLSRRIAAGLLRGNARIIVAEPPRHGKSMLCSCWTPTWFLDVFPDRRVLLGSYGAEFASEWGRRVRNNVRDNPDKLLVRLSEDSTKAHNWFTTEGGGMATAGIGGPFTGRGGHLLVVDDPIKDAEEARSQVVKDNHWDWWQRVAYTRLEPGASIIAIMTRWVEDDLVGRILEHEGDQWEVICLPALAEDDDGLGRARDEALWPERYSADALASIRQSIGSRAFASMYQQRPAPEGGGMFRRKDFRYFTETADCYVLKNGDSQARVLKSECRYFVTVDTAMKENQQSDFTVGTIFAMTPRNDLLVLDVDRDRIEIPDQWSFVQNVIRRARNCGRFLFCAVEDKGSGVGVLQLAQKLGVPMRPLKADRDKVTRATPASVWYENGMVYHREAAPWLDTLERELLTFPNGAHDDQVDTIAYAVLEAKRKQAIVAPQPRRREREPARSLTGMADGDFTGMARGGFQW